MLSHDTASPILSTDAIIVSNIAGNLPTKLLSDKVIVEFKHFMVADSVYNNPAPIDVLQAGDLFLYIYEVRKYEIENSTTTHVFPIFLVAGACVSTSTVTVFLVT